MKKHMRKMLVFLLILTLAGGSGTFPTRQVFAGSLENSKEPLVISKTAHSITLKTEENLEYAVKANAAETEVPEGNSSTWNWAEENQYDREQNTVTFQELNANAEYEFTCRTSGTKETENLPVFIIRTMESEALDNSAPPANAEQTDSTPAHDKADSATDNSSAPSATQTENKQDSKNPAEDSYAPDNPTDTPDRAQNSDDSARTTDNNERTDSNTDGNETTDSTIDSNADNNKATDNNADSNTDSNKTSDNNISNNTDSNTDGNKTTDSSTDNNANSNKTSDSNIDSNTDSNKTADSSADNSSDSNADSSTDSNKSADSSAAQPDKNTDSKPQDKTPSQETPKTVSPPAAPTVMELTDTDVTLQTKDGQEYAIVKDKQNLSWQNSGTFRNLEPETEYSFVARIKTNTEISSESEPLTLKTKFSAATAPDIPEIKDKTDCMLQVVPLEGQEYALLENEQYSGWNTNGRFENLTPKTDYQIVTRKVYDNETAMPSKVSEPLRVTTKSAAANAPETPGLAQRTETQITLQPKDNLEYAISSDNANWMWQDSNVFEGLAENTSYQFIAREKFDSNEAMPSKESPAATFKTYMAFQGRIDGIIPNETYYRDTKLTANAIGTGMEQTSPGAWDSRWVPRNWNWDEKTNRTWDTEPYSVTFILNKTGNYKLTVGFELEEYISGSWKGTGQMKTVSVEFKAVAPVYTITASAGKNGAISPAGSLEAKEGNSQEFTFTPNKGYKISKVLVDGKEVTVKDGKYTISNIKSNHEISVSFEKTNSRQTPKTGDENPVTAYGLLLLLCGTAVIFLLAQNRRKKQA